MSKWLKKGDKVRVIAGNDKGRTGEVLGFRKGRVLVQGINVRKKHVKRSQQQQTHQIVEIECGIDTSNVAICDAAGNPIRLSVQVSSDGNKNLVYEENGKQVLYRKIR